MLHKPTANGLLSEQRVQRDIRHSAPHDYALLVRRWRAMAKLAGLPLRRLGVSDGLPTFFLRSPALGKTGGLYVSAGIHGDEAAATEALLAWAEMHARKLADWPVFLVPCLNPWGLTQNRRTDASDRDLNRSLHRDDIPHLAALKRHLTGRRFEVATMLHEDYDGQGIYLYELAPGVEPWGHELLASAREVFPPDPRRKIDISRADRGVIQRKKIPAIFEKIGLPEAIYLQRHHAVRTYTVETPSEAALERRVAAQVCVLDEIARRVGLR